MNETSIRRFKIQIKEEYILINTLERVLKK